jgi:ATP-binding cassette subfamily F protein 3
MLTFSDVTLRRGPRALLTQVSLTVHAGWRVGVVGRNGTGKSSLFAMILGELTPDAGEVALPRRLAIATVAQETPAVEQPALEYALDGDVELRQVERELEAAEAAHDGMRIAHLHEHLATIDGYAARARAARLLHGLGFSPEEQAQPVASFSGGWRMRLNLARALLRRSDLLLLDEPTNHLDLDTVVWLQGWLVEYPGTLLVISHDREFLDAVTTHTLHLAQGTATLYTGNHSQFERQRAERMAQQSAVAEQQRRKIEHLQAFIDRFKAKASKARQAQSRIKMIERIERVAVVVADPEFEFEFPLPPKLPAPMIRLDDAAVGYDERTVLGAIKLSLAPGDRVGLLGPNGEGKTTLVRLLAGELPARAGTQTRHPDLRVGYFAQHQLEQLDTAASPLAHFKRLDPAAGEQALRNYLGGFHFLGDRVFEPVGPFSGGEKARLALALVVYRKPNLLLLDEPTNHLDLDMRQALELALQEFAGALVLVSHDRHLVGATCDTLWRVSDGRVVEFDGDLDDYAAWLATREREWARRQDVATATAPAPTADTRANAKQQRRADAEQRRREKPLRDALRRAEQRIETLKAELATLDARMQQPDYYAGASATEVAAATQRTATLRRELAQAEDEWLGAAEALEALVP